ncbi:tripartite motif-containing protein 2-like [Branchiostoma floridae x Branchiostoma belcheri]
MPGRLIFIPVAMAGEIEPTLFCSICLELFLCPLVLPCRHSFCKKCISDWIGMAIHQQRAEFFTCPECRMPFSLPPRGIDSLPFNHVLANMADACRKSGNGGNFGANGNARLFPRAESRGIQPPGGCREHGKSLLMYCMVCEEECCLQCIKEPGGRHPAGSPQHNVKNKYVATSLRKVSLMDISIGCRKTQMKITDVEMALSNNTGKAISEIKSQMEAIKQVLDFKTVQMVASVQAERAEKQERLDAIKRGLNAIREDSRFLLAEGGNSEKFLQEAHAVQVRAAEICASQDWNDHSLDHVQQIPSERQLQAVKRAVDNIFCQETTNRIQVHGDGCPGFEQARSEFTPGARHRTAQGVGGGRDDKTPENKACGGTYHQILTKQPESTVSCTENPHLTSGLQLFPSPSVSDGPCLPTIGEEITIANDRTPKMPESMPNKPTKVHANRTGGHKETQAQTLSSLTREDQNEERVMFQQSAKLYLWEPDREDWKQHGAGDLKILRHNVTGKARVLMWNDGTYSVQANHYITADMKLLDDKIGGEDALVWAGIDAADGSRKEAYFAATFSQPTAATVYKKVFERCVARETVKERTASAGTPP